MSSKGNSQTEAEWEYACRAGTTTPTHFGETLSMAQANIYSFEDEPPCRGGTTSVTMFQPNAWGLFDMHGNLGEWCWDWYAEYSVAEVVDPVGPDIGQERIFRSGGYHVSTRLQRSAKRSKLSPSITICIGPGIRLVRSLP